MKASHLISASIGLAIGLALAPMLRSPLPRGSRPGGTPQGAAAHRPSLTSIPKNPAPSEKPDRRLGEDGLFGDYLNEPAADEATITAYLERHNYSKEAVLASALLSPDPARLREAIARYPDDPNLQLLVISSAEFKGEKSEWLERFKKAQPDNAVASLLLGGDLLARGSIEDGISELRLAVSQDNYNDFATEGTLAMESALIEFGHPLVEAKLRTLPVHAIRHLQQLQEGIKNLQKLAESAGSPQESTELATLGVALGNHLSQGEASHSGINRLVGYSVESQFLKMLDPDLDSPNFSTPPGTMLEEVKADTSQLMADFNLNERIAELSDQQVIHLVDRVRTVGQPAAWVWLREQLGEE